MCVIGRVGVHLLKRRITKVYIKQRWIYLAAGILFTPIPLAIAFFTRWGDESSYPYFNVFYPFSYFLYFNSFGVRLGLFFDNIAWCLTIIQYPLYGYLFGRFIERSRKFGLWFLLLILLHIALAIVNYIWVQAF